MKKKPMIANYSFYVGREGEPAVDVTVHASNIEEARQKVRHYWGDSDGNTFAELHRISEHY